MFQSQQPELIRQERHYYPNHRSQILHNRVEHEEIILAQKILQWIKADKGIGHYKGQQDLD